MKHQEAAVKSDPGPTMFHGRPAKRETQHIIVPIEVDKGDFVLVHFEMATAEIEERAERTDIPDMRLVIESRFNRESKRRFG